MSKSEPQNVVSKNRKKIDKVVFPVLVLVSKLGYLYTSQKNIFPKVFSQKNIFLNVLFPEHFPERSWTSQKNIFPKVFSQKNIFLNVLFPELTFVSNHICQKSYLPEITSARRKTCLKLHLPESCLKLHLPEWTLVGNYNWQSEHLSEITFSRKLIF